MTTLIANVTRGDRPGREWPVVERLRALMGNAQPGNRTGYEQTAADAIERIVELEATLRVLVDGYYSDDESLPTLEQWDDARTALEPKRDQ